MREKKYIYFLIISVILSHGIIGISSENYSRKSSDFHVRNKRVINHEAGRDEAISIRDFPYNINLKKYGVIVCTGSILSHYVVITAAHCVPDRISLYKVYSGTANAHLGILHDVETKIIHPNYNSEIVTSDIALLKIHPRVEYSAISHNIELHASPLLHGTVGVVSGWGCQDWGTNRMTCSDYLRSISVPIINRDDCMHIYQGNIPERSICTFDTCGQKKCAVGDSGAPLVVNSRLVGVFSGRGHLKGVHTPDIFVNVADQEHASWIKSNLQIIESKEQEHQNQYDLHNPHHPFFEHYHYHNDVPLFVKDHPHSLHYTHS